MTEWVPRAVLVDLLGGASPDEAGGAAAHPRVPEAMVVADSVTCFTAALTELGLDTLKKKFDDEGWTTYNDFAFSSSDSSGKTRRPLRRKWSPS